MKAPFNITENKIEAIKKLRVFATETFGVAPDLMACKAFIDILQPYQQERFARIAKLAEIVQSLNVYDYGDIIAALEAVGLHNDQSR